jgi:hypothetical protein
LLLERLDEVAAIGSEAGGLYGEPIEEFERFWLQAGPHVLFVVDRIRASRPVTTVWNWLLNNRDDTSELNVVDPRTIVMRRRLSGLKIFHLGDGRLSGPVYAYVHDAYHPEPNQHGEGQLGSGMLYRWIEPSARSFRVAVHAFAMDDYGLIDHWQATSNEDSHSIQRGDASWTLTVKAAAPIELTLRSEATGRAWRVTERNGDFAFSTIDSE